MISSILIPTYNQKPDYLRAALQSALLQTVPVEVIVVDDGSQPPQEPIVLEVERAYRASLPADTLGGCASQVIYAYQANGGVAAALNMALGLANGDYIQWLSSDDLFRANKTAVQVAAMQQAKVLISYSAYEEGVPQVEAIWPAAQYPSREALYTALQQHCFINACTVIWKREVFDELGTFDPSYRHAQDFEFLLRCARRYNFLGVQVPLVRRRVHPGQMINTLKQDAERQTKAVELARLREEYGAQVQVWVPN